MTGIAEGLSDAGAASKPISPAHFDAFLKAVISFVKVLKPRFISILNSRLLATDKYGRTMYEIDFSAVFPSPKTMAFVVTKEDIQALAGLGTSDGVLLFEDASHYYIAGENGIASLRKYRGTAPRITPPALEESDQIGETVVIEDTDSVSRAVRSAKWTGLLTHDGQLTGFLTPGSLFRIFTAELCSDVIGKVPDSIMYKSHSFLKLVGSTAHLNLFNLDGQTWLKTTTNIGKPKKGDGEGEIANAIGPTITVCERLTPAGMNEFGKLFSLLSHSN